MNLRDLDIELTYETTSEKHNLLEKFYIPVLSVAKKYYRIAGFFSSTSLSVALKGIEGLVNNGGKMYLLISPELSISDYEIIKESNGSNYEFLFKDFKISDFKENEHLKLLAWMLCNDKIEIKIVIDKNSKNGIFHQKVGIIFDGDDNIVSFSGSVNESAKAWLENIEEFKTFRSWENGQTGYLFSDLKKFSDYWNNERNDYSIVYDLPDSIRNDIVNVAPKDVYDLNIMREYLKHKNNNNCKLKLFSHQSKAVKEWIDNDYNLLMEMATGTGKTRTAIGCMLELLTKKNKILVIIATPQGTLSRQWKTDIESLDIKTGYSNIIDGSNPKWKVEYEKLLIDLISDICSTAIIYSTHDTVSSEIFLEITEKYIDNIDTLFICDEVHGIGSTKQKKALLEQYKFRIGLSATPERMYDEYGTSIIVKYFGNKSFKFTIHDALTTINPLTNKPFLNSFYYKPIFVTLSENELKRYKEITRKIMYIKSRESYDEDELNTAYNKRADILKNATAKYSALEEIIEKINNKSRIKDTIIFVSDKQIKPVMEFLSSKSIVREKITEEESTSKKINSLGVTERQDIINKFKNGTCQVLLGLKCLDEGIDIPNARIAILMSNSTNPREYVQRVGRVIRQAKDKEPSIIYDLIVDPCDKGYSAESIIEKEARRAFLIAVDAINHEEVIEKFKERGVDLDAN